MRKFDFNKMQTGLFDRIAGAFAPKNGKRIEADKLALIEILFNGILILGAIRVIDAMLVVNAGMAPALRYGVAIATLILTEGGLIIWRAFRYKKTANKTQRDIAMFGMGTSFIASLAIGVSDYIGAALGENTLVLGGADVTGHSLMVFVTGVAYAVAIVGHIICGFLVKEFDDQVAADSANNFIEQEAENARRATALTERRAEVAADGLVRQAGLVSGVLANLSVAPTAATVAAVSKVRKQIVEQYSDFISVAEIDSLLGQILADLPGLTQHAYSGAIKEYLADENTVADLGLHPERVADAIQRATANMEGALRGALGAPRLTPLSSVPRRVQPQASRYTLNDLLSMIGGSPADARQKLENFGLTTASAVYAALQEHGMLPPEMTFAEFAPLYDELMAPVYVPASAPLQPIPAPVYQSGNGNGHQPNFQ